MTAGLVFFIGGCVYLYRRQDFALPPFLRFAQGRVFFIACAYLYRRQDFALHPFLRFAQGRVFFYACAYLYRRSTKGASARLAVLAFLVDA